MDEDKIFRAYTRLNGIKDNIPEDKSIVPINHIKDYHDIIASLEKEMALSLLEFKIPSTEIAKYNMGITEGCKKSFFMSKLDALLSYFQLRFLSTKEPEIGFKPPNKEKEQ